MLVFTSCTCNYIPKARVLAASLKSFHPDWEFCLLLGEAPPEGFDLEREPFDRLLTFDQLPIPEYRAWLFRHRVVEICTAAKGPAMDYFISVERQDKVMYLDPDIMVLHSLAPLETALDQHDILLTPHQLAPQQTPRAVIDNEICSLKHGVYNLGFAAVANRGQGPAFCRWWRDRLYDYCYDDIPNGIFTDQRWCDLAPAFFPRLHIVRDPGCNAASWNLTDRTITRRADGVFMANDTPLRFYHFTGYDSGAGKTMTSIYGADMPAITELWDLYAQRLEASGHAAMKDLRWQGMFFSDGTPITDAMRLYYRNNISIQERFPDPFQAGCRDECYLTFYKKTFSGRPQAFFYKNIHRISKGCALTKIYVRTHGGLRRAGPQAIAKLYAAFKAHGLKGIIHKICIFNNKVEERQAVALPCLADISKGDPTRRAALRLPLAAAFNGRKAVCIIDHMYGGGANSYRQKRIAELRADGYSVLLLTWDFYQRRCVATAYPTPAARAGYPLEFQTNNLEDILACDFLRFDKIILNELVLWSRAVDGLQQNSFIALPELLECICRLAARDNAALEVLIHDFYAICPSYCLLDAAGRYCGVSADATRCAACLHRSEFDIPANFDITQWRAAWARCLETASTVRVFSQSSLDILCKIYPITPDKVALTPHAPLTLWRGGYAVPQHAPMRVAVVGEIGRHKGAGIVAQLAGMLRADQSLVVIGSLEDTVLPLKNVTVHGPYRREELPQLFKKYGVTVGLVPSVWPETFCYVVQECMQLGLPLVAFNLGAQGERVGKWEHGLLADEISAAGAYKALLALDARRMVARHPDPMQEAGTA